MDRGFQRFILELVLVLGALRLPQREGLSCSRFESSFIVVIVPLSYEIALQTVDSLCAPRIGSRCHHNQLQPLQRLSQVELEQLD